MNYPHGHNFNYRQLRPSQIKVDPLYQRPLDVKRVERIAAEFNGDTFNEPKVSYRDGIFWCWDGQHGIAAWRKLNGGKDEPLVCKVYTDMTWADECEAFMRQNGIAKDPTTNEKLRAAANKGDESVLDMVAKANLAGFVVDWKKAQTPTRIVATGALYRAYKTLGGDAYLDMMTAIHDAWYGDQDAVSYQIISGMTGFYKSYYGRFKREDLVKALRKIKPAEIIRDGRANSRRPNTYMVEILRRYNSKRRYKLEA